MVAGLIQRRYAVVPLLGVSLLLITGCRKNEYQPPPPPTVSVAQPIRQAVTNYLEETGTTEAVERVEVRTPIAGRVGKTLIKAGNLVDGNEATHLTTVIQYDPIYANFNISERSLLRLMEQSPRRGTKEIKKGDVKILLRRAGDTGFPFEGHLDYADLAVDQSTGTYMIRGIFPNPDLAIVPGLFVRVRIPIGVQEAALLIPERAIGSDQAGKYVFVVNSENRVERRDIVVGVKYTNMVVVEEGLDGEDWVITDGVQRSRPGAEVAPRRKKLAMPEGPAETVETGEQSPIEEESVQP